jgi:hypothetical protein
VFSGIESSPSSIAHVDVGEDVGGARIVDRHTSAVLLVADEGQLRRLGLSTAAQ